MVTILNYEWNRRGSEIRATWPNCTTVEKRALCIRVCICIQIQTEASLPGPLLEIETAMLRDQSDPITNFVVKSWHWIHRCLSSLPCGARYILDELAHSVADLDFDDAKPKESAGSRYKSRSRLVFSRVWWTAQWCRASFNLLPYDYDAGSKPNPWEAWQDDYWV